VNTNNAGLGPLAAAATALSLMVFATLLPAISASRPGAQAGHPGVVMPLASAKLESDGQPPCLKGALENGNPDSGPSTFLLEAASGCVVPAHYHTAEEQLLVVSGDVLTGMDGMKDATLGAGGFAMMPSKAMHWFTCESKMKCLMFVTFDRKYDIVWAKPMK
jgi:quercetin dioxygenase-like cupin family protein